jgi:hypothetical protein
MKMQIGYATVVRRLSLLMPLFASITLAACTTGASEDSASNAGAGTSGGPITATATTVDGLYQVTYRARIDPIAAGNLHSWDLSVATAEGQPVEGAAMTMIGGMPIHTHGMATEPQIVAGAEPGAYVIEGIRFQMSGEWEVTLGITAGPGTDSVTFPLEVADP